MSEDAELRELERRCRATGSADDEARWLAARVRAGVIEAEAVLDAAWAGDEAARRVHGEVTPHDPAGDPGALVLGVRSWTGAVLAMAEAVDALLDLLPEASETGPRRVVALVREAASAPAAERARRYALEAARMLAEPRALDGLDLVLADLVTIAAVSRSTKRAARLVSTVAALDLDGTLWQRGHELGVEGRGRFARSVRERIAAALRRRARA